jgi:hypothetical protein
MMADEPVGRLVLASTAGRIGSGTEAPPGRVDVFQLHLIHANAEMVQLGQFLHPRERLDLNILPSDSYQFVGCAVADYLTHYGFGQIAEGFPRIAHIEEILPGVFDTILDDPLHERCIQVTGDHGFFFGLILADLDRIRQIARGGEPKLKFQLAPSRQNGYPGSSVQALKRLIRWRGDLASKLTKQDRSVHVVMTASATQFVTPLTLQTLSRHPVTTNILRRKDELASGAYRACR